MSRINYADSIGFYMDVARIRKNQRGIIAVISKKDSRKPYEEMKGISRVEFNDVQKLQLNSIAGIALPNYLVKAKNSIKAWVQADDVYYQLLPDGVLSLSSFAATDSDAPA